MSEHFSTPKRKNPRDVVPFERVWALSMAKRVGQCCAEMFELFGTSSVRSGLELGMVFRRSYFFINAISWEVCFVLISDLK